MREVASRLFVVGVSSIPPTPFLRGRKGAHPLLGQCQYFNERFVERQDNAQE